MNKGIIFDLDGVITDTAQYHFLAWQKMANKIGIEIDEAFNEELKGVSRVESAKRIIALSTNKFSETEIKTLCEYKNILYLEYLKNISEDDILPGIKELLIDLKSRGYKLAIASASLNAPYILEKLELLSYFDYIADSVEAKYSKPSPAIFELACKGINVEECVGVEDSQAGVEAIKRAGLKCIGIGANLENCDIKLNETKELTYERISDLL